MESNEPTMQCFMDGLNAYLIDKAEKELGETEEVRRKALLEIKSLINDEHELKSCTDDVFLLRFLRARKFNVQKAFELLQKHYRFKARHSGSITDFTPSALKHMLQEGNFFMLENRDQNGSGICIVNFAKFDIDKYTPEEIFASNLLCAELGTFLEATQICGYTLISDCSGMSLRMAKKYAYPSLVYNTVAAIQDYLPCRLNAIHIINEPFYFHVVMKLFRFFLSEKLKQKLHLHGRDLKSLHKHVSPDVLPLELDGKQGPYSDNANKFMKRVYDHEDSFARRIKHGYQGQTLEKLKK